jgi:hypothetical protein
VWWGEVGGGVWGVVGGGVRREEGGGRRMGGVRSEEVRREEE